MKLLLVLMAVMSFTVESKTTVSADGLWPYDMSATYANTYNKGQVRANDVATLTLSGLNGITIDAVEVSVKSNRSSGAGTFTVSANGQQIVMKTGSLKDWFGAFNNVDFQALSLLSTPRNNVTELVITLTGTESSLYIDRYTITWSQSQAPPMSVTLMNGSSVYTTLTETAHGYGVVLPVLPDLEDWQFIGWSSREFWETPDFVYALYPANERFYPSADGTLWAVYRSQQEPVVQIATELTDGEYLYVNRTANIALTGVPEDGIMDFDEMSLLDKVQHYHISFAGPDTAYITHVLTGTPIGYSGTQMATTASPWLVNHEGEETLFYMLHEGKTYVLWLNIIYNDREVSFYAGLMKGNVSGGSPMVLVNVPNEDIDPIVTCHPGETQGIDEVTTERANGEYRMPFGPYDLIIKDGKKYLRIRE